MPRLKSELSTANIRRPKLCFTKATKDWTAGNSSAESKKITVCPDSAFAASAAPAATEASQRYSTTQASLPPLKEIANSELLGQRSDALRQSELALSSTAAKSSTSSAPKPAAAAPSASACFSRCFLAATSGSASKEAKRRIGSDAKLPVT